ncbi:hypothetical protein ILUMI_13088 [Ignelater luminosus]|uniref:RWD domain-containing protein n=1 Tax=Ignelater luminosus TaxID=2038154 RepID=A0A8K0GB73_IGNLU|nr:hypothetical protein ILUMI_13088 [Ignelater luminosus]
MELENNSNFNQIKLKETLQTQLSELEMLQSMFYNPGEIRVDDLVALKEITDFVNGDTAIIPPFLDITINLMIENTKFELCINLSHEYPEVEPDIYVRNHKMNRNQHAKVNKDLTDYIIQLERNEPCIFSAISWLQDNANNYIEPESETVPTKVEENEDLVRYWIYSHHIYSKSKRREILDLAHTLKITGFCMPGKPGIICIEGAAKDCNEWWQAIKSMNWKRIFCKISEECKEDKDLFLKFDNFEEKVFQNSSIKCNHMDMGELFKFLEDHKCGYVFKDLFGVEAKTSSSI